jgi:hypothetical protein
MTSTCLHAIASFVPSRDGKGVSTVGHGEILINPRVGLSRTDISPMCQIQFLGVEGVKILSDWPSDVVLTGFHRTKSCQYNNLWARSNVVKLKKAGGLPRKLYPEFLIPRRARLTRLGDWLLANEAGTSITYLRRVLVAHNKRLLPRVVEGLPSPTAVQ